MLYRQIKIYTHNIYTVFDKSCKMTTKTVEIFEIKFK